MGKQFLWNLKGCLPLASTSAEDGGEYAHSHRIIIIDSMYAMQSVVRCCRVAGIPAGEIMG